MAHTIAEKTGWTEAELGNVLDITTDGKIDRDDQSQTPLTEEEFATLAQKYFNNFPERKKSVDVTLWSPYADGLDVRPLVPENNQIGEKAYVQTDRQIFIESGVSQVQITGLIVCIGVTLYDPVTKTTFAAHYSPNAQFKTLQEALKKFEAKGIPLSRLQGKTFYGSRGSAIKAKVLAEVMRYNGLTPTTHFFESQIHNVEFDVDSGMFWQEHDEMPEKFKPFDWRNTRLEPHIWEFEEEF